MLLGQLGLIVGWFVFISWGGAQTRKAIVSQWPLIAAAGMSIGVYSLVLVRPRYVGAFVVVLSIAVLIGIRLPKNEETSGFSKYVTAAVMATPLFSVLAHLAQTAYPTMTVDGFPAAKDRMEAAVGLQSMGLHAGDQGAVIGDGMTAVWARLGRFKVVSEIYSPAAGNRQFWSESPERRSVAYEYLRRRGAKMVVVWSPPESGLDPGWKQFPTRVITFIS